MYELPSTIPDVKMLVAMTPGWRDCYSGEV